MAIELTQEWAFSNNLSGKTTKCSWCKKELGPTSPGEWTILFYDVEDDWILCEKCAKECEDGSD